MPGIASQPTQTIDTSALASIGSNRGATPAINDFMEAFRSGFITTDDLIRRGLNAPVEQSARQTSLAANDLQRRQITAQGQLLPGAIQNAQDEQTLQATVAPAKQELASKQARDLQLLTEDPDAYHAEKTDEALRQAYIQRKGRLPESFTIKNPNKPLGFVEWSQQNLPSIQARRDALLQSQSSMTPAAYEEDTAKLNNDILKEWQQYVRDNQTIKVSKGSPEYAQALHDEVTKLLETEAIKGAQAKALPGILENQAKGTTPHNVTVKRALPNGTEEEVLVQTDPQTGAKLGETVLSTQPAKLTEVQANTQLFANRLGYNDRVLSQLEQKGFDPSALATTVQRFLPNRFKSDELQSYNAAKNNWISAVLRKESGAAISTGEYNQANKEYFPQDGDSPAVVKQKQGLRKFAEEQMHKLSGPGGTTLTGASSPGYVGSDRVVQNGVTFQWNGTAYVPVQ